MFNNREVATIIWLFLLFLWVLSRAEIRSSLPGVVKALLGRQMVLAISSMLAYVAVMVLVFSKLGFWDQSAIKDTVFWVLGGAVVMFFNVNKAAGDEHYFRKVVSDNLKLVLVLEFLVNVYTFGLLAELVIVPLIALLLMLKTFVGLKAEYKKVDTFLGYVLGIIGLSLLAFAVYQAIVNLQVFANLRTLRDFLLPPVLSIAFLPFIYGLALYMTYDGLFRRMDFFNGNDPGLARYAKWKSFTSFHVNLKGLNEWSKEARGLHFDNRSDVLALIQRSISR